MAEAHRHADTFHLRDDFASKGRETGVVILAPAADAVVAVVGQQPQAQRSEHAHVVLDALFAEPDVEHHDADTGIPVAL